MMSDSSVIKCVSCGCSVMFQCRDKGWQAIQMDPKVVEMNWYCPKEICKKNQCVAMAQAAKNWGVSTVEPQEIEENEDDGKGDPATAMISGPRRRPSPIEP